MRRWIEDLGGLDEFRTVVINALTRDLIEMMLGLW